MNTIIVPRKKWKISPSCTTNATASDKDESFFVGEWATRVGSPTPNMAGALGDASLDGVAWSAMPTSW